MKRKLQSHIIAFAARKRRKKGNYDYRTLAMFRSAWIKSGSISSLLNYLLFRRDLGFPIANRWVAPLSQGLKTLNKKRQRLAVGLLAETDSETRQVWLKTLCANNHLTPLYEKQEDWRDLFTQLVQQKIQSGICVVGNAGVMNGAGFGRLIDQHGLVVRFNHYRGSGSKVEDIGEKLDVWVVAPNYKPIPPPNVQWIVVSGPDIRYRLQNWANLYSAVDSGIPLLTIPLQQWRELVAQLQAPPSAGLLFLAWLRALLKSWDGVTAVGFGVLTSSFNPPDKEGQKFANKPYHHADRSHKAADRHNWFEERVILQHWENEGLTIATPR
jgi:Glycosyltransferase family 29 (sialyltransferase)